MPRSLTKTVKERSIRHNNAEATGAPEDRLATNLKATWGKLNNYYSRLDESPVYYAAAALHPYFVGSRASCVEATVKTNSERRMSYLVEDQSQLICLQDLDASNEAHPVLRLDLYRVIRAVLKPSNC
jgi:hypothetical protein